MRKLALSAVASFVALSLSACAPAPSGLATSNAPTTAATTGDDRPIARIHASKCGSCHVPVAPGSRPRDEIEHAMSRHGKRLKLTGEQWSAMVDYLAPPMQASSGPNHSAQNVR